MLVITVYLLIYILEVRMNRVNCYILNRNLEESGLYRLEERLGLRVGEEAQSRKQLCSCVSRVSCTACVVCPPSFHNSSPLPILVIKISARTLESGRLCG